MSRATTTFLSRLAPALARYVDLKRALGRRFDNATDTLKSLDKFLKEQAAKYPDLSAAAFQAWCQTQEHHVSGVRRKRMLEVYNFFPIPPGFRDPIKGSSPTSSPNRK
jgi:hypothetical protein